MEGKGILQKKKVVLYFFTAYKFTMGNCRLIGRRYYCFIKTESGHFRINNCAQIQIKVFFII